MKKSKRDIAVGDTLYFHSGNYYQLSGTVTKVDWESKDERAIYGYLHEVTLSNGKTGFIEKSEHWEYKN